MSTVAELVTAESRLRMIIRTSLYDLIDALNAAVEPEEETLVVPLVMHWLETGRITFPGRGGIYN